MKQNASGKTNSLGALLAALANKNADTVYFLSDGTPTAGETTVRDDILLKVSGLNTFSSISIHALAFLIGEGKTIGVVENKFDAERFMEKLARENGGFFRKFE
jgi:predicted ATP-dependent endonuclease of OLD family